LVEGGYPSVEVREALNEEDAMAHLRWRRLGAFVGVVSWQQRQQWNMTTAAEAAEGL
jgi:hypothetical protein